MAIATTSQPPPCSLSATKRPLGLHQGREHRRQVDFCTDLGIDLSGSAGRLIERDDEAVNALRAKYTYVFTTGGIGPTHDDITADAIASAFLYRLLINSGGARHAGSWIQTGTVVNEARLRHGAHPRGREPHRQFGERGAGLPASRTWTSWPACR